MLQLGQLATDCGTHRPVIYCGINVEDWRVLLFDRKKRFYWKKAMHAGSWTFVAFTDFRGHKSLGSFCVEMGYSGVVDGCIDPTLLTEQELQLMLKTIEESNA